MTKEQLLNEGLLCKERAQELAVLACKPVLSHEERKKLERLNQRRSWLIVIKEKHPELFRGKEQT